ncbi:SIR2 family protein [Nonlabens ulvanivorans]|uniref:SIR2-like protein n=1 Tax=Nonlabens ulvanivorans TaxID=906888 RepID=A0A084K023_NONUL|nr:SIR2 family protein [Nonlabens ulvanivorans]KEZ94557.1 hypothetical protein IL45_00335 [Nonlabens ulvanivorans]PRX12466.1 SIR2-like protein [Nonlabens ulvanivorans]
MFFFTHLNDEKSRNYVNIFDKEYRREFEVLLLGLLDDLAKQEGKKRLHRYPKFEFITKDQIARKIELDAIIEDGFLNIPDNTLVEIKSRFSKLLLSTILNRIVQTNSGYKSVLLIFADEISLDDKDRAIGIAKRRGLSLIIWDNNEVLKLIKSNEDLSLKILSNIGKEVFNQTIEYAKKSSDDWILERDQKLVKLKKAYENDEIILMLGAGASKDAGVPSWNELLKKLNLSIINEKISDKLTIAEKDEIADELVSIQNGAPIVSASYIRSALGENFKNEIKKALYRTVKPIKDQPLLETISKLAQPRRRKVGIESIITYNFDDLLEKHLKKNGVEFKSMYREADQEEMTKLPIYHVHGFIPRDEKLYTNLDQSVLVFSEDGYLQMQSDPYSWSNIVQIKALREKTCVLIGLSGIDPNLRRLFSIHSEKYDGCKHYILLEREIKSTIISKSKKYQEFSKLHHKIQEDTFNKIGLNVIWYEDHKEVPSLLEKLRTNAT